MSYKWRHISYLNVIWNRTRAILSETLKPPEKIVTMNTGINPGIYLEYLFRFWQQLTDYTFHIASGCCSWWNTIDNMENVEMISFFNKQGDFMSFRLIDFKKAFDTVGCNAVRLFADDTSLLSYGLNLNDVIIQAK